MLEGMRINKGMKHLDFSKIGMTSRTAIPVLQWMGENYQMRTLNLSLNSLGDGMSKDLLNIITTPNGLTTLKLAETKISVKLLTDILEALSENKSIRTFDISRNKFDKKKKWRRPHFMFEEKLHSSKHRSWRHGYGKGKLNRVG